MSLWGIGHFKSIEDFLDLLLWGGYYSDFLHLSSFYIFQSKHYTIAS